MGGQQLHGKQFLISVIINNKAVQVGLAFLASLLLVGITVLFLERQHSPPYAQVFASRSSADVTIFLGSNVTVHAFELTFSEEVGNPRHCDSEGGDLCMEWSDSARLTVTKGSKPGHRTVTATANTSFQICFSLNGDHLYGGPLFIEYPSDKNSITNYPFTRRDFQQWDGGSAETNERRWFSSSGLNLEVHPQVPLFVTQNSEDLCFIVNNTYPYSSDLPLTLSYDTCEHRFNMKQAFKCFFNNTEKPVPPVSVIAEPMWSTSLGHHENLSTESLLSLANEIKGHKFGMGIILLDGPWESCYGSLEFSQVNFPNPKTMVKVLHDRGALVSLKVHPFISTECENAINADDSSNYMISAINWTTQGTVQTNDPNISMAANLTNPEAIDWFVSRLKSLKRRYGVDSFRYSAETETRSGVVYSNNSPQLVFTLIKPAFRPGLKELGARAAMEKKEFLLHTDGTNSTWSADFWVLKSVIPAIFQLSLHGFSLTIPEIFGREYLVNNIPSKELFIRWIQLNTFLPILQIPVLPWHYDKETVEIVWNFTKLHYSYKDRIIMGIKDPRNPLINPLWWISPKDRTAQELSSEFLLGTDLLVAPVLEEGATSRDIYLPQGKWHDENYGVTYQGPTHIYNYSAPLNILPYFQLL